VMYRIAARKASCPRSGVPACAARPQIVISAQAFPSCASDGAQLVGSATMAPSAVGAQRHRLRARSAAAVRAGSERQLLPDRLHRRQAALRVTRTEPVQEAVAFHGPERVDRPQTGRVRGHGRLGVRVRLEYSMHPARCRDANGSLPPPASISAVRRMRPRGEYSRPCTSTRASHRRRARCRRRTGRPPARAGRPASAARRTARPSTSPARARPRRLPRSRRVHDAVVGAARPGAGRAAAVAAEHLR